MLEFAMMDLRAGCNNKLCKWTSVQFVFVTVVLTGDIMLTDGKLCVKREEIGNRDGNLYTCEDIVRTECCERNRTFTCCEPPWKQIMHDQLWLLLVVVVIALLMCLIISWCCGQIEVFSSPTAKDAAKNWRDKLSHTFDAIRGKKTCSIGSTLESQSYYTPLVSTNYSSGSRHEQV